MGITLPNLEYAGTYIDTPHNTAQRRDSDIVIKPTDNDITASNVCDYHYVFKYYPNCNDDFYNPKYKPGTRAGIAYYNDEQYSKMPKERLQFNKMLETLFANPDCPNNHAYRIAMEESGEEVYAQKEKHRVEEILREYLFALFQSNRSVFVYSHPHFTIDWEGLTMRASYAKFPDFLSKIEKAMFNAECLIRFVDPDYVSLLKDFNWDINRPWARNQIGTIKESRYNQYKDTINHEEFHRKIKSLEPTLDARFNSIDNTSNHDLTGYEKFLVAFGYMPDRDAERRFI